jgi:hypothetical protein
MFETEIPEPDKGPASRYIVFGCVNLVLAILGTGLVVGNFIASGKVDPIRPFVVATFYMNGVLWLWRARKVIPQAPTSKVLDIVKSEQLEESHK